MTQKAKRVLLILGSLILILVVAMVIIIAVIIRNFNDPPYDKVKKYASNNQKWEIVVEQSAGRQFFGSSKVRITAKSRENNKSQVLETEISDDGGRGLVEVYFIETDNTDFDAIVYLTGSEMAMKTVKIYFEDEVTFDLCVYKIETYKFSQDKKSISMQVPSEWNVAATDQNGYIYLQFYSGENKGNINLSLSVQTDPTDTNTLDDLQKLYLPAHNDIATYDQYGENIRIYWYIYPRLAIVFKENSAIKCTVSNQNLSNDEVARILDSITLR